ncbi:unnamed protein product [Camellia sinensis]
MEDSVNDQSSAAANARRSSSILRYPLRSATKSKEEKPPAAELSTSAPKRDLVLIKGLSSRKVGATSIHLESSQSHIVFTCVIESWCKSRSPPPPSQLPAITRLEEQNDRRTAYDSFGKTTDPASLPGSLSLKTEEQDDSGARTTSCTYGRTEEQPSLHIVLTKSKRTISKGFMEGHEQWQLIVMPGRHLVLIF